MNYVYRITTKKDAPKYWQGKTKTVYGTWKRGLTQRTHDAFSPGYCLNISVTSSNSPTAARSIVIRSSGRRYSQIVIAQTIAKARDAILALEWTMNLSPVEFLSAISDAQSAVIHDLVTYYKENPDEGVMRHDR